MNVASDGELKITDQHPEVLQNPEMLQSVLLPLESFLLRYMLIKNTPQNKNMLYRAVVKHVFKTFYERELCDEKVNKNGLGKTFRILYYHKEDTKTKEGWPTEPPQDIFEWVHEPNTKHIREAVQILKDAGESPPSAYTINQVMEILEGWGFVTKRYESSGKTQHYWIIHPKFNAEFGDSLRKYFKEHEVELEW